MAAELLDECAEDAVQVAIAWMKELRPKATSDERFPGDVYPFTLIEMISVKENVDEGTVDAVVGINTLCNKDLGGPNQGRVPAFNEKEATHRRMLLLARHLEDVPLAPGRNATLDYVRVFQGQKKVPSGDDHVIRYEGRYEFGFSYQSVQ